MIRIIFDSKTRLRAMQTKLICFPEILEKAKAEITDTVPLSVFDFFGMTVAEFLQLQEKTLPKKVTKFLSRRKATFFDYVKITNTFEQGMKAFERIVEDTIIPLSAEEEAAQNGLASITTEEAMLTFLRDYFGLHNLSDAQTISLYEYCTARKVAFNSAKFQKNLIQIQKTRI